MVIYWKFCGSLGLMLTYPLKSTFQCVEFHASARKVKTSQMEYQNSGCSLGQRGEEYSLMVTSTERVANLIKIYKVTFFK